MSRIILFSCAAALCFTQVPTVYSQVASEIYDHSAPDAAFYGATSCANDGMNLRFSAELMVLDRHDTTDGPFIFDVVTFESLLPFESLGGPAETGVRVGITFVEDESNSTEFNYFQMDHFGGVQSVESANGLSFGFFGGFPATPEEEYTVHYTSVFQSFEVNRRRGLTNHIEGLIGFRYFDLNETLNIVSDGGTFSSAVDNDLYGIQLGGDILLRRIGHSNLVTSLKGGIYYDNADVTAEALNPGNGQLMKFINDEDELAFIAEIKLGFWVPMGSRAALNIGYQGFYLDGIGLAPHQFDNTSIFTGQGDLDSSSVWFHGGYVGFELTF